MMVAEKATPRIPAGGRNEHEHHRDSSTTCRNCDAAECLYFVGRGQLCAGCVTLAVSLAANDLWPDLVSYKREFEEYLL